jgi:hypothetical protein
MPPLWRRIVRRVLLLVVTLFGREGAQVLVNAHELAMKLDVRFCSAIVFFVALRALDSDHAVMDAQAWQSACRAIPPHEVGQPDIDRLLAGAIERARFRQQLVRPIDLFEAAAASARSTVVDCLATIGDTLDGVRNRLTEIGDPEQTTDDSPPVVMSGAPRYAVVVQGPDFIEAGNRYATFDDAQRACASLRLRAFGEEMPSFPSTTYAFVFPPARIREATAIYIREL